MTKEKTGRSRPGQREIVSLADLVPAHDVKGGGTRRVFGADAPPAPPPERRQVGDSKRDQPVNVKRRPTRNDR